MLCLAGYIVKCPPYNPPLPVESLPKLEFEGEVVPGATVRLDVNGADLEGQYLAFFRGLGVTRACIGPNNTVTIPAFKGQTNAVSATTTSDSGPVKPNQVTSGGKAVSSSTSSEKEGRAGVEVI